MKDAEIIIEHDVKVVTTSKVVIIYSGKERVILLPYQAKAVVDAINELLKANQ